MEDPQVQRLRLEQGDILVVKIDANISQDMQTRVRETFGEFLTKAGHPDIQIMVIDKAVSLSVLSA